jgi:hypothetical protein
MIPNRATTAGRVIALLSFVAGITLVATFTGVMGSVFASVLREHLEAENSEPGDRIPQKPLK